MAILQDVERLLPSLSRGEKAQLLKWVVQELGDDFPGVDSRIEVCGGEPCIVPRIPVWVNPASEETLLHSYPSLRAEDLANAWGYVRSHPDEIDQHIRNNEAA